MVLVQLAIVYAWAAMSGSPVDVLGAMTFPSFSGLPAVDARLRALDRWHTSAVSRGSPYKPHWLANVGGLPHAHGDAAQLAAMRRALAWAFVMTWGQRGVATLMTFILAALLGPDAFGLVALAMIYVALIQLFLEQGLAVAIIQREDLKDEHLDSAFWLNIAMSVALAGVTTLPKFAFSVIRRRALLA